MRRLLSIAVVVGACVAAVVLAGATNSTKKTTTYKVVLDNGFGLTEGGDFRVGGVKAGKTKTFDVSHGKLRKAVVTATVDQPGFGDFRSDATCDVRPQSLIGEYYLDCQPGYSKQKLKNNTVPVEHTSSTIPQDLINDILRRPYRERFRLIISELGTGLAGRPTDLAAVLRRAHPGLRETSKVLRILGKQNKVIENFISNSDKVVGELEGNKKDVVRFIKEAGRTAEISATRREQLRQTFRKFPGFLDELRPTMARLGELADQQVPLLADLQRGAPQLNEFLTRLGPFSEASRPAIRSLGKTSVVGSRTFRKGADEVKVLRQVGQQAKPTFKPLRQFLQTSDDRKRAIENDPRAKVGGPPSPDPTAIKGQGGFTGLEAIWSYFFWQGQAINGFDDTSHILRIGVQLTNCSPLKFTLTKAEYEGDFKKCLNWTGPNQPGITSPDPTGTTASAARLRAESGKPAKSIGERRTEGQPEAGPLPGQRDISKPQITLPPAVKQLIDELPAAQRARARERLGSGQAPQSAASDTQLLDFLLGP